MAGPRRGPGWTSPGGPAAAGVRGGRADTGGRQMTTSRAPVGGPGPGLGGTPGDARPRRAAWLAAWTVHHPAGRRPAWRRLAGELVFAAVFGVIYEQIRDHMVQAGSAAARPRLAIASAEAGPCVFRGRGGRAGA